MTKEQRLEQNGIEKGRLEGLQLGEQKGKLQSAVYRHGLPVG
ncbi:hypothetical protein [Enterobacter cloacae]